MLRLSDVPESVSQLPPGVPLGQTKPDWSLIVAWATSRNGPGIDSGSVHHSRHLTRSSGAATIGTRSGERHAFTGSLGFNHAHAFSLAVAQDRTDIDAPHYSDQCETAEGARRTQPGILLVASPLPDGSFDVAELVLLSTPTSTVRLGPPRLAQAGSSFSRAKPLPLTSR